MSLDYWERRQVAEDAQIAFANAEETIRRIERLHAGVERRIRAMHTRIRQRFKSAYNLSEEKAKELLSNPVGREEYLKLLEEIGRLGKNNPMREELLAKAAAPAYAYRMKLADAMELENDAITAHMAEREQKILEKHLTDTVKEESMRAGFRIQHRAGVAFRFNGVSEELARVIISRPWSGMSFSERIWKNREALSEWLNEDLASGLVAGVSGETLARELSEKMDVSMNRARTLVRTETTHVCSAADFEAYEEAGLEEYMYSAVLDVRTSRICRRLDHKRFKVKDKQVGVNCPPMHPNCRSVTVTAGISDEELARMTRWARDPVTGKGVKVPANMSYEEWRKLQAETYGEERVALGEKMARNKKRDERQLQEYRSVLGKKHTFLKSREAFQQMKYLTPETYEYVKLDYARQRQLQDDRTLELPNAKHATAADEKFTKYLFNSENKNGWAKGVAFASRLGYNADNWQDLQKEIQKSAGKYPTKAREKTQYGTQYEQKIVLYGLNGKPANVVVGWMSNGEKTWMTTAMIKEVGKGEKN